MIVIPTAKISGIIMFSRLTFLISPPCSPMVVRRCNEHSIIGSGIFRSDFILRAIILKRKQHKWTNNSSLN